MGSVVFSDSFTQSYIGYGSYDLKIDFSEAYNSATNSTTIRITGVAIRKNSNSANYGYMNVYGSIKVGGTTILTIDGYPYQANMDGTSYRSVSIPSSGSVTIPHDASGRANATFEVVAGRTNNGVLIFGAYLLRASFGVRAASKSVALTTHPRISTVTATDAYIGDPVTIALSRYNESFTHTVKVMCAGNTETLMTKGSTYPTLTWTPALATYAPLITNAMSATATITCETYNGDTLIGSSTATCTLTLKAADVAPSVSISTADPTGNLTTYGKFVKGKSKITVTLTPTLAYGATLATTQITANGASYTSSPATTDFILSASNTGISATIRDSRGQTATASATIQIYDYDAPKINAFSAHRCNADGTENNAGAYMAVGYSVEVSPLGNQNAKTLTVKYKKISASTWSTATITLSAYTETGVSQPIAVDTNSTYNVQLVLEDDFSTGQSAAVAELVLPTASTRMNWGAGENGGIAIGKVSEYNKTLEIADDWNVHIGGDLEVEGSIIGSDPGIAISDTQPTGDELVWIDTDDDGSVHQVLELSDFDSASGHCKMPDGTLIQWGSITVQQGSTAQYVGQTYQIPVSLSLPIPFVDTNYRVFGSSKFGTGGAIAIGHDVSQSTESSAYIRAWDYTPRTLSSSVVLKIWWTAIGRWR